MNLGYSFVICIVFLTIKGSYAERNKFTILEDSSDTHPTKFVLFDHRSQLYNLNSLNGAEQNKDFVDWIGLESNPLINRYLSKLNKRYLNSESNNWQVSNKLFTFTRQRQNEENEDVNIIKRFKRVLDNSKEAPQYYSVQRLNNVNQNDELKNSIRKMKTLLQPFVYEIFNTFLIKEENPMSSPRFLDEIAEEIEVLENKKDSLFSRNRFKRILIPMLIVLKLFKLKLLMFLPIILGLVSFKKFLAFVAIIIPSVIGLLKLYKPVAQVYTPPVYLPSGIGFPPGSYKDNYESIHDHGSFQYGPLDSQDQKNQYTSDNDIYGQKLAYQSYQDNQLKYS